MEKELEKAANEICRKYNIEINIEQIGGFDPVKFDEECLDHLRTNAKKFGYSYKDIVSGAGHDACWTNTVVPSASDYVPLCRWIKPQ